jgi:hypothetical protein
MQDTGYMYSGQSPVKSICQFPFAISHLPFSTWSADGKWEKANGKFEDDGLSASSFGRACILYPYKGISRRAMPHVVIYFFIALGQYQTNQCATRRSRVAEAASQFQAPQDGSNLEIQNPEGSNPPWVESDCRTGSYGISNFNPGCVYP